MTTPKTPTFILVNIAKTLLKHVLSHPTSLPARHLLATLNNRHPTALKSGAEALSEDNEELETKVDQIVVSLAVTVPTKPNLQSTDAVLRSIDADEDVRIAGIKGLVASLDLDSDDEHKREILSALIARIQDSSTPVLEALYEHKPSVFTDVLGRFHSSRVEYVKALNMALSDSKPKRAIVRLHLTFLFGHAFKTLEEDLKGDVFYGSVHPFLGWSKPREKTAECVWELVHDVPYPVLTGCSAIITSHKKNTERKDEILAMVDLNATLVRTMAENIVNSDIYAFHLRSLLLLISSSNPHLANFSQMLVNAVVTRLTGEHQVEAALSVLDAMPRHIEGIDWSKWDLVKDVGFSPPCR